MIMIALPVVCSRTKKQVPYDNTASNIFSESPFMLDIKELLKLYSGGGGPLSVDPMDAGVLRILSLSRHR